MLQITKSSRSRFEVNVVVIVLSLRNEILSSFLIQFL